MKRRKWDPKTKAIIVVEGLKGKPIADICIEQQMLAVGRALMSSPKLLLLDEPSLGLAPLLVQELFRTIKKLNEETKTSMLIVEQNIKLALSIATTGYVMYLGKIVLEGTAKKILGDESVRKYLSPAKH